MPDTRSVVDDRLAPARIVPRIDVGGAVLELERRRDSAGGLYLVGGWTLGVLMEVDESRRDNQSSRIDGVAAGDAISRYGADRRADDADIAHRVEACFRIDDPSAED